MNINILLTSEYTNEEQLTLAETIVLIKGFMISFLGSLYKLF